MDASSKTEVLCALHEELKIAARHHETLMLAIIAAQITLLVGIITFIADSDDFEAKAAVTLLNLLVSIGVVFPLLMAHRRGRERHIELAGHMRREMSRLLGNVYSWQKTRSTTTTNFFKIAILTPETATQRYDVESQYDYDKALYETFNSIKHLAIFQEPTSSLIDRYYHWLVPGFGVSVGALSLVLTVLALTKVV